MALNGFSWIKNFRKKINNNWLTRKLLVLNKPVTKVFVTEKKELKQKITKNHKTIESKKKIIDSFAEKIKFEKKAAEEAFFGLESILCKSSYKQKIHSKEQELINLGRNPKLSDVFLEFFKSVSPETFFNEINMSAENAIKLIHNYNFAKNKFNVFKTWQAERTRKGIPETVNGNPLLVVELKKFVPEEIIFEMYEYERAQRFLYLGEIRKANSKNKK
jgi:predicted RND superfamily exporter protein